MTKEDRIAVSSRPARVEIDLEDKSIHDAVSSALSLSSAYRSRSFDINSVDYPALMIRIDGKAVECELGSTQTSSHHLCGALFEIWHSDDRPAKADVFDFVFVQVDTSGIANPVQYVVRIEDVLNSEMDDTRAEAVAMLRRLARL